MKTFQVLLTRSYIVDIEAENSKEACECAEFFIGDPRDASTEDHRKQYNFRIHDIEMTMNEAIEAEEVTDDDE